jgi:antitoxin MazE
MGDSLAVRIPAYLARRLRLSDGDQLKANLTVDGRILLHCALWDRKAFAHEMNVLRKDIRPGRSVMDEARRGAGY